MSMRKLVERIPIIDFKVGDIYFWEQTLQYRIVHIERRANILAVSLKWNETGRDPADEGEPYNKTVRPLLTALRYRITYFPRDCAPCYDSDCDCIHDNVDEDVGGY